MKRASPRPWTRRELLRSLGRGACAAPLAALLPAGLARAADSGVASRVIFFYYPDGVPGVSQAGQPSLWHPTGSEYSFALPECLTPLADWSGECVFLNGLSMGATDAGSHPGGAKKLLTACDGGNGESIDQYLARTVGSASRWRHLYLGAAAGADGASADKFVSYYAPGQTIAPEDNPRVAFELLFGTATSGGTSGGGSGGTTKGAADPVQVSVIDGVLAELSAYRTGLGTTERAKLDLHLESLREVEQRVKGSTSPTATTSADCGSPSIDTGSFSDSELYTPEKFPDILRAQMDLMVLAMACGHTRVGTIQASHHTSDLVMSRFAGSEMYDPSYDMRSHQASHYGATHDASHREFSDYVKQRRWWVEQLRYLLERLDSIPEGEGTMLDSSLVVMCTEVCDGNLHLHDNMPLLLAGRAGGRIRTGRLLDYGYRRHGDLWVSVAHAMGEEIDGFGDASSGPLEGLVE